MLPHDIYICGTSADRENADALARGIRNYKMPRNTELPDKSAGYGNVLVDVDERPLDEKGQAVLGGCRFFVLLCSPESRASAPVMDRFAWFEKNRGKTWVIAVLCGGEPIDAFPDSFIEQKVVKHMLPDGSIEERIETIEPVASDLRGQTKGEVKRLLRYETVRIVATVMGIAPDVLERRHNRRVRRRITIIAAVLGAVLLSGGAVLSWFSLEAAREGRIAALQAEQSQAAAKRMIEDVPAMFADDPQAQAYVREGILETLVQLSDEKNALLGLFDLDKELAILPDDGLNTLLQKAALRRVLGASDAAAAYRAAVAQLDPECDKELFLQQTDALSEKPTDILTQYGFYVTRDSGVLSQGDIVVAVEGQSFNYIDGWVFETGAGNASLTGALAVVLSDELFSLRVLRHIDGAFVVVGITASAAELAASGAVCV